MITAAVVNNPHFKSAEAACSALKPQNGSGGGGGGLNEQQLLAFAQCMRTNGVPQFPDPVNGGISIQGVDPSSPAFQHAAQVRGAKTGVQIGGGQ